MIDYLTLALTSGLIALALWRLLWRDDLDHDAGTAPARRRPWVKGEGGGAPPGDQAG